MKLIYIKSNIYQLSEQNKDPSNAMDNHLNHNYEMRLWSLVSIISPEFCLLIVCSNIFQHVQNSHHALISVIRQEKWIIIMIVFLKETYTLLPMEESHLNHFFNFIVSKDIKLSKVRIVV